MLSSEQNRLEQTKVPFMKRKFMLAVSNTYCDVLRYDVGNPCPGLGRHTNVEEINR